MDPSLGRDTRLYAVFILFVVVILGVFAAFSGAVPDTTASKLSKQELPMSVFIREMSCSGAFGEVALQSWGYNDYPLPYVSLEIPGLGSFKTDEQGIWTTKNLPNGTYHVSASKENYEKKSFDFFVSCPVKKIAIRPSE